MWYRYTMEYYLFIKMKEVLPFVTTWMNLGNIKLSEIRQTQKDRYYLILLKCGI